MKKTKMLGVAGVFAFFQALMPLIGWLFVHTILQYFERFEKFIPWIAMALLVAIGVKMLVDGIRNKEDNGCGRVGIWGLLVQGVATSIDALSVGFDIGPYKFFEALVSVSIIGVLTFVICLAGIAIGKKFGTRLANKATILGGIVLIIIGIEIFVTGVFDIELLKM